MVRVKQRARTVTATHTTVGVTPAPQKMLLLPCKPSNNPRPLPEGAVMRAVVATKRGASVQDFAVPCDRDVDADRDDVLVKVAAVALESKDKDGA